MNKRKEIESRYIFRGERYSISPRDNDLEVEIKKKVEWRRLITSCSIEPCTSKREESRGASREIPQDGDIVSAV